MMEGYGEEAEGNAAKEWLSEHVSRGSTSDALTNDDCRIACVIKELKLTEGRFGICHVCQFART